MRPLGRESPSSSTQRTLQRLFSSEEQRKRSTSSPILGADQTSDWEIASCSRRWSITATSSPGSCWLGTRGPNSSMSGSRTTGTCQEKTFTRTWRTAASNSSLLLKRRMFLEQSPPFKCEAGTTDISGAIGLGAAVEYLSHIGLRNIRNHERDLTAYALDALGKLKGMRIYGPADSDTRGGVISFNLADIHAHDMAS